VDEALTDMQASYAVNYGQIRGDDVYTVASSNGYVRED